MAFGGGGGGGLLQVRPCIFQQVTELVCVNNATAVDQINPGWKGATDREAGGGVGPGRHVVQITSKMCD